GRAPIDVIRLAWSFRPRAPGTGYLPGVRLAHAAGLRALGKPMSELGLAQPPADDARLEEARRSAELGISKAGWRVTGSIRSPVKGARGATEFWVHAGRLAPLASC